MKKIQNIWNYARKKKKDLVSKKSLVVIALSVSFYFGRPNLSYAD